MTTPAKWKPQPADSPCKCCRCDHPEQIAEADDWLGHTCFVIHQHGCDGRHGKRDACNQDAPVPPAVEPDDVVTRAQALYTAALDSKPGKGEWPTDALVDAVTVIPDLIRQNQQLRETITRLDLATDELADSVTQLNAELVEVQSRNAALTPDEPVATTQTCSTCGGDGAIYEQVRVGQAATPFVCSTCGGDGEVRAATTVARSHDPRCISLTDSEFNTSCDCRVWIALESVERVLALLNGEADE
ncbi:hypothetical protein GCM10025864_39360 [Luteimicrobium album]|uniref:Uncharacterized protein n=1 Tax=Luteimicrobium album TaxID=1054550 RepID=A0ABQ6I7H5_9MICO|nr:hypothetical protein [Luteimicrobium album]GMA26177.1 hypothetical protein GCM10025864_39360 [Luteimicrobium album]